MKNLVVIVCMVLMSGCIEQDRDTFDDDVTLKEYSGEHVNEIAFVGDSIARNMANYSIMYRRFDESLTISNRAHGGDCIEDTVNGGNWQAAFVSHPKYVVINLGINDVLCNHGFETITSHYTALVENALKTGTVVYIVNLVPDEKEGTTQHQINMIGDINAFMNSFKEYVGVVVVDCHTLLSFEGHQVPEYFTADVAWPNYFGDGLHPNCQGMALIIDVVKEGCEVKP